AMVTGGDVGKVDRRRGTGRPARQQCGNRGERKAAITDEARQVTSRPGPKEPPDRRLQGIPRSFPPAGQEA
ncbi:MAG: hypothetical protein V3T70_00915, partial [Phycisphaerae bacterium]